MNAALAAEAAASQAATVACNNKTKPSTEDDNKAADYEKADSTDQKAPASKKKGAACCQNKNANNKNKKTVQPCQRYNQNAQARCNRRCANAKKAVQEPSTAPPPPTRIVVQRTPIHMDDSQPEFAKMSLDVTGFAPHQIKVSVDDYVVSISGERRNKLGDLFVIDRKFRLDKKTALVDGVEASFDDDDGGILEIVVPENVLAGPRTIPIAVTSSSSAKNDTNEETEVNDNVDDVETAEDENAQTESASTPADEEEQEALSVETVKEEDADEEEVEDEQQTDATTEDSGGDVVVTEGLEWEEVASEEKE